MAVDFSRDGLSSPVPRGLGGAISAARRALLAGQQADDTWSYVLEPDCANPAEYILFLRHVGNRQGERGGCRIEVRLWSAAGPDLALL
jgi:hypothetical protein